MRIIYHHRTTAGDAQGIHIREIIRAFRNLGHEVEEVSIVSEGSGARTRSRWSRAPRNSVVLAELMKLLYNPVGYFRLTRAVRRFQPDFIFERYAQHCAAGVIAGRRYGIPLLLEVNSPLALEEAELGRVISRRLANASERWILSRASRVVCVSSVLKSILEESGVPSPLIEVCANGVDPERFHGRNTGEAVRARYGLDERPVLGFVGWLRDWHGLAELVQVLPAVVSNVEGLQLLIVGDGPARESVEEAAVRAGLADAVHITGPLDQDAVVDHIAAFDIALQPAATPYASPMKIFEYLAMGKPVIAPRQANIEEILSEGVNARFFAPEDLEDLVRVVGELVRDRERCRRMGVEARKSIFERQYLWSANAARMIQLANQEIAAMK